MQYDWEKSKLRHELEMYAKFLCELAGVPQATSEKGVEMAKQLCDEPNEEVQEDRYRREAYEEMLAYFGGKIPEGFEWDYENADLIPVGQRQ